MKNFNNTCSITTFIRLRIYENGYSLQNKAVQDVFNKAVDFADTSSREELANYICDELAQIPVELIGIL